MNKKAFTLAETMIVLVILGVVAAITIPALVRRHVESSNRTRIRKAMAVYDTALNKMIVENGIKSDTALVNWADSDTKNDCANTSAYFKVSRNLEVNGNSSNCKFRAADGVFWDISDIKKPLVALREQDLNDETAQSDTNRAFYMFGWLDEQGSLRSNDMGKIDATNKADLEKLYDFIAGKTKTSLGEIVENSESEPEPKTMNDIIESYGTDISDANMKNMISELKNEGYKVMYADALNNGYCAEILSSLPTTIFSIFDQKAYAKAAPECYIKIEDNNGNSIYFRSYDYSSFMQIDSDDSDAQDYVSSLNYNDNF